MEKLQDKLFKLGISTRELSLYEGIEDSEVENYIKLYHEGKNIPESLKEDFDFIVKSDSLDKAQIIYHLMRFEEYCNSNEEKPFVKKLYYHIRTMKDSEILEELKKNNIEVEEVSNRKWKFTLCSSNINITFLLIDERLNHLSDEDHSLVSESLSVYSYNDILDILKRIKGLYLYSQSQETELGEIIKSNEYAVSVLNEIQDVEYDKDDLPAWENDDKDFLKRFTLLNDIKSMVNDCINHYIPMNLKILEDFREHL